MQFRDMCISTQRVKPSSLDKKVRKQPEDIIRAQGCPPINAYVSLTLAVCPGSLQCSAFSSLSQIWARQIFFCILGSSYNESCQTQVAPPILGHGCHKWTTYNLRSETLGLGYDLFYINSPTHHSSLKTMWNS